MKKKEAICQTIRDTWSGNDIINVWNAMDGYETIYSNDGYTLCECFGGGGDGFETFANSMFEGDYNPRHIWFSFDACGNLVSFDFWDDENSPIILEEIAEYLIDNGDSIKEVDTSLLAEYFIYEYYEQGHRMEMLGWVNKIIEEETFDLLTEDWDDLYVQLKEFSGTDY